MEIEDSSLWREVEKITESGAKPIHYYYTADIHTPNETIPAMKVLSIDFVEDAQQNYADYVVLRCVVGLGKYAHRIYPNKSKLEITVYRNPIGEMSSATLEDQPRESERYTATLFDRGSPVVDAVTRNAPSEEVLDLSSMETLDFQLVDKGTEQIRMQKCGINARKHTVEEFLQAFMMQETRRIVVDDVAMPNQFNIVPPHNTTEREHFVIPQGFSLVDVPHYVQNQLGGIYSTGLGYYLTKDAWWLWPAFDTTRFDKAERTLTIINVPKNRMPGGERTYRQSGRNLVVLATGDVKFTDDSEALQLNEGNGVRSADSSKFMKNWVTNAGNKATASRGASTNEFVGQQRDNGNNNVGLAPATSNSYVLSSVVARRMGSRVDLTWESSDRKLLQHGMPIRLLYLDQDEIKSLDGVILGFSSYVETVGPGLLSTRHRMNTMLSLFVERKLK